MLGLYETCDCVTELWLPVVGVGVLRLDSVQLSDTGVYVCMWNTSNDWHWAHLNLSVIGNNHISTDAIHTASLAS